MLTKISRLKFFAGISKSTAVLSFIAILNLFSQVIAQPINPLKRFPDIYKDKVVFVSGEDIWIASIADGNATRLTFHEGEETFPKFSPDGKLIAFTGEYDGNADVYVMDIYGGNIKRLTWHPGYDEVVGWNPVNNKIIFRSNRNSFSRFSRLFMISADGTGLEEIPIHEIAQGSFSPDGNKIAYNKVSRENRTWKRYKGGTAQEVYIYDFTNNTEKNITNFRGTDRIPMWIGDKIYFSSDRDGILNLYSYNTSDDKITQLTFHKEYDIRRPSPGINSIVYEIAGEIYRYNIKDGKESKIDIAIKSDFPERRPYLKSVENYITSFDLAPSGKRALITARGETFSVPKKHGMTYNLTETSGAREKDAVYSPDGEKIAYISDEDGEYQIYLKNIATQGKPVKLTDFKNGYRHTLKWSPNGKWLSFTDQTLSLYLLNVKTGKLTKIDKAEYENIDVSIDLKPIYDYSWSPDSRWIAYVKMNSDLVYQIWFYSLDTGKKHLVSGELFNDFNPVFSKDGKYLFFISNRRFSPTYGDFEWEMVYKKMAGIYSLALTTESGPLFPYKNDPARDNNSASKRKNSSVKVRVDFRNIQDRIEAFPLPRGNYRNLTANEEGIFFMDKDEGDFNKFEFRSVGAMDLYGFRFTDDQKHLILKSVNGYRLSPTGKDLIYRKGKSIGIIKSSFTEAKEASISLSDLKMRYDPYAEWLQIFNEAWRLERDFYYEPGMHGLDWPTMKSKYLPLIQRATCRQDVRFVIGELIGELNTSHTYVFGGDRKRKAERVNVGLLAADWQIAPDNGLYRFKKIYREADFNNNRIPPLLRPDIKISEGDYLLKVNGKKVSAKRNIYSYFVDLAGKQITITVNSKPSMRGAKTYTVKPVGNEYYFRYLDWVEHNRKLVDKISNGEIGYLHFPDTYNGSAVIFPKYFYSQTRKKGLIIDGRFNGGGLDPDIFLRRLRRKPGSYWTRRYSHDQIAPTYAVNARMVCITNRQAGSGGDELPWEFRQHKMGPVIGTRSWGGLVGVSMFISMIDGGGLTAPDYRIYSPEGKWVVENEGVEPDIIIDLQPKEMFEGKDAQLLKAVEILKKQIKENPPQWPEHEPFPTDNNQ